jgi:hypothetical protein
MRDRGYENLNKELNEIERSYLFGELRERKINAIKAVRELPAYQKYSEQHGRSFSTVGLKDAKDLVEIWLPPDHETNCDIEYLLEVFGYRKIVGCPSHNSVIEWREVGRFEIHIAKFCPECGKCLRDIDSDKEGTEYRTIERKLRPRLDL